MSDTIPKVNDVARLRSILFDTLEDLKSNRIDVETAKAISETAQVIINSAKVEIEAVRVTGGQIATRFLTESQQVNQLENKTNLDGSGKEPAGYVHKMGSTAKINIYS